MNAPRSRHPVEGRDPAHSKRSRFAKFFVMVLGPGLRRDDGLGLLGERT
jgi:hypothetical protein